MSGNLRASEPLGGGLRASGSVEESVGLALVVAAVLLGVLCVLACAWFVMRGLVWLAVRVGRFLWWLLVAGPKASDLVDGYNGQKHKA